jgi:hypothetical protein
MAIPEGFFRPGEDVPTGADILAVEVGTIDGYRIVYLQTTSNWSAYSLDLPGIYAGGVSREDAEARFRAALPGHLAPPRRRHAAPA